HQVLILTQERVQARLFLLFGETVRPILGAPFLDFSGVEPARGLDTELLARFLGGQVVPAGRIRCPCVAHPNSPVGWSTAVSSTVGSPTISSTGGASPGAYLSM